MKMKAILLICLGATSMASAQLLPPAGEEWKGAPLKEAIKKLEAAGIKELKAGTVTVPVKDLTALSASRARYFSPTGISMILLADLPDPVKKQIGYNPVSAAGHEQAKEAMDQKARVDTDAAIQKRTQETVKNQKQADEDAELRRLVTKQKLSKTQADEILAAYGQKEAIRWLTLSTQGTVMEGMPERFAVLAWGLPSNINRSSNGPDQWVYRRQGAGANYLYMEDGLLKSWQTSE